MWIMAADHWYSRHCQQNSSVGLVETQMARKALLEQLLAIIRALDLDPDVGSRSAMIRQIDGDSKKTAWEYVFDYD